MKMISNCPLGCRSQLVKTDIALPEGALLRCPDCGQLLSQCTEAQYRRSMAEFDTPAGTLPQETRSARRAFALHKRWLNRIRKLLHGKQAEEIRILDVGCSSGRFLRNARSLGFHTNGVEPAPKAAAAARSLGLDVREGYLEQAEFADGSFDALTLFEVIEHLRDPVSLVRECHRVLKPGGILLIGTGNTASWSVGALRGKWDYFDISRHGGHISFFNMGSMSKLLEANGFQVAELRTTAVALAERAHCRSALSYRLFKVLSEPLTPLAQLLGKGHQMYVFARKSDQ